MDFVNYTQKELNNAYRHLKFFFNPKGILEQDMEFLRKYDLNGGNVPKLMQSIDNMEYNMSLARQLFTGVIIRNATPLDILRYKAELSDLKWNLFAKENNR